MIKITDIDHIVLRTCDSTRLIDFYCKILGCNIERTIADYGITQLRAGSAMIDIVAVADDNIPTVEAQKYIKKSPQQLTHPKAALHHNLDHFCLNIEAITAKELIEFLDKNQVVRGPFETRYGANGFGDSVYISDPDGNVVELKVGSPSC